MKRVEKFGAFVAVSGADLTGLVHLSELSDDFVKEPATHLQPGQRAPCLAGRDCYCLVHAAQPLLQACSRLQPCTRPIKPQAIRACHV